MSIGNNFEEYREAVLNALNIQGVDGVRNFENYRRAVLTKLGVTFTEEDLRNEERWRLKVLEGINSGGGGGLSIKTASGAIVPLNDAVANKPILSLKADITPKQSGSGDPLPSNVRPISGYEGVNVTRCGKNILPKMTAGTYSANGGTIVVDSNGVATLSGTTTASGNVAIIPLEEPLTITSDMVEKGLYYHLRNSDINANISPSLENNSAVNLWTGAFSPLNRISGPAGSVGIGKTVTRIRFYVSSGVTLSGTYAPSLEFTNEVTEYEPYQGTSYPISLGQTVYGGTLDVVSGKLTINKRYVDLGSLNWNSGSDTRHTVFYASFDGLKYVANNVVVDAISSQYRAITKVAWSGTDIDTDYVFRSDNSEPKLYFRNLAYTDATAFKTAMNGVQLVYELATPTEVTLTPTQVKTLLGNNNIFADSGSVEVEYIARGTVE